jgi:hypothetical protein
LGCYWEPSYEEEALDIITRAGWEEFPHPPLTQSELNRIRSTMVEIIVDATNLTWTEAANALATQEIDTELVIEKDTREVAFWARMPNGHGRWWFIYCGAQSPESQRIDPVEPMERQLKLLGGRFPVTPVAVGIGLAMAVILYGTLTAGRKKR